MTPFLEIAGWTLIHFLWQGTAIGLATALALKATARRSANVRYVVACAGLALMLAAPVATARLFSLNAALWNRTAVRLQAPFDVAQGGPEALEGPDRDRTIGAAAQRHRVEAARLTSDRRVMRDAFARLASALAAVPVDRVVRTITICWLVGVSLLLGRMAGGWWYVRRLHHLAMKMDASPWQAPCRRIAYRLGLPAAAHVVELALVEVPTVVGWLRPAILLPMAAMAALSPAQIEAVLAHELAHIRRHDYAVNLLQTIAETVLFYHPAVWWLSARVRTEREHCCDEVAVRISGDAVAYARALAELEAWRTSSSTLALAATGGSLLERVRRILRVPVTDEPRSPGWAVTLALTIVFTAGAGIVQQFPWVTDRSDARAAARDTMPVAAEPSTQTATPGAAPDAESIRANERAARLQEAAIRAAEADALVREEIRRAYEADLRGQERHVRAYARMMRAFQNWFELSEPPEPPQPPEPPEPPQPPEPPEPPQPPEPPEPPVPPVPPSAFYTRFMTPPAPPAPPAPPVPPTPPAPPAPPAPPTPPAPPAPPAADGFYMSDNGERRMSWSDGRSRLDVTLHGSITFTEDLSDVATLSDGGWLKIRDRGALVPHTVEVHASKGRLSREYYVGGLSRPWGPEAQQLLASKIVLLVRQFGFGAEERVKTILEKKGVNGVMEEIGLLTGDYARRLYFVALIDEAKLDARTVVPILQQVGDRMSSDYDRRLVLERAAARVSLDEPATTAYVAAIDRMKSSYDKRLVLTHLVEHNTLSANAQRSALAAIPRIQSDYDRRLVLTAYVNRYGAEGLREPFGEAVQSIKSNYDRRQVLTQVARNGKVPPDVQRVAFDLVGAMSSDYDRAEILLAFVNAGAIDPASRPAFVSAAESIRSSHDQNRVLAALVKSERR